MGGTDSTFQGTRVVDSRPSRFVDSTSKYDKSDYIESITTRSCRILHGSYSWLVTMFSQTASAGTADPIEHWWAVIKTKRGNYYMLQFRGRLDLIELRKCKTNWECNQCGLAEAAKTTDADIFRESRYCTSFKYNKVTIGDVVSWLKTKSFSPRYHLLTHNCQDLCKAFDRKFG